MLPLHLGLSGSFRWDATKSNPSAQHGLDFVDEEVWSSRAELQAIWSLCNWKESCVLSSRSSTFSVATGLCQGCLVTSSVCDFNAWQRREGCPVCDLGASFRPLYDDIVLPNLSVTIRVMNVTHCKSYNIYRKIVVGMGWWFASKKKERPRGFVHEWELAAARCPHFCRNIQLQEEPSLNVLLPPLAVQFGWWPKE